MMCVEKPCPSVLFSIKFTKSTRFASAAEIQESSFSKHFIQMHKFTEFILKKAVEKFYAFVIIADVVMPDSYELIIWKKINRVIYLHRR